MGGCSGALAVLTLNSWCLASHMSSIWIPFLAKVEVGVNLLHSLLAFLLIYFPALCDQKFVVKQVSESLPISLWPCSVNAVDNLSSSVYHFIDQDVINGGVSPCFQDCGICLVQQHDD